MPYRVVLWTTGHVASFAGRAVVEHPEMELVGAYAWSPEKAGVDVGELIGTGPLGITATSDVDELLALRPDVVGYYPIMRTEAIPEHVDPPLQREYKRLINAYFTPAAVARYEVGTRELVTRLIDAFAPDGACDFMTAFARPFPGLAFFDMVLNAPSDEVAEINAMSTAASLPTNPNAREAWQGMYRWIVDFVEQRRSQAPRGDVVDAVQITSRQRRQSGPQALVDDVKDGRKSDTDKPSTSRSLKFPGQ